MEHPRDAIDILQALLTPIIAVVAVGIAFAQWWTARNRFKLDLFDRRWKVYQAVMGLLGDLTRQGATTAEQEQRYLVGIRGVKWLFNDKVDAYLYKSLWRRVIELQTANSMLEPNAAQQLREQWAPKKTQVMLWLQDQYGVVDRMFGEFLQMDQGFFSSVKGKWRRIRTRAKAS